MTAGAEQFQFGFLRKARLQGLGQGSHVEDLGFSIPESWVSEVSNFRRSEVPTYFFPNMLILVPTELCGFLPGPGCSLR